MILKVVFIFLSALINLISILTGFRKDGHDSPFKLSRWGVFILVICIPIYFVLGYLQYLDYREAANAQKLSNLLQEKQDRQRESDISERIAEKKEFLDTIKESLRPFGLVLDQNNKVINVTNLVTNNNIYSGIKQRKVTAEDIKRIINFAPDKNAPVTIWAITVTQESKSYSIQVLNKLKDIGYTKVNIEYPADVNSLGLFDTILLRNYNSEKVISIYPTANSY